MPPAAKIQKSQIIDAAFQIVRQKGIDTLSAREIGSVLQVSTRPIFTYFDTMKQLRGEVYRLAKQHYRRYIERGLAEPIPFLGVGQYYIRFAKEEPQLYKLLFLTKPDNMSGGAMETLQLSQNLVRESIMRIYKLDAKTADCYFRNLWLAAFSFATLIVTDDCPYTDAQIAAIFTEISLAMCKAYKEITGFAEGRFDRDRIFRELVGSDSSDNVSISLADISDLPEILRLQYEAFQSEAQRYGDPNIQPLKQTIDELTEEYRAGTVLKMCDISGRIIGSVRARQDGSSVYIGKLMVAPQFRRRGYASRLIIELESRYPHCKCRLFTGAKSIDNILLYERLGYVIYDTKILDDIEFVYMEKQLL